MMISERLLSLLLFLKFNFPQISRKIKEIYPKNRIYEKNDGNLTGYIIEFQFDKLRHQEFFLENAWFENMWKKKKIVSPRNFQNHYFN